MSLNRTTDAVDRQATSGCGSACFVVIRSQRVQVPVQRHSPLRFPNIATKPVNPIWRKRSPTLEQHLPTRYFFSIRITLARNLETTGPRRSCKSSIASIIPHLISRFWRKWLTESSALCEENKRPLSVMWTGTSCQCVFILLLSPISLCCPVEPMTRTSVDIESISEYGT